MARTENAWRCSQCGAINEPGSRACHNCGKWPSLFDLQASVDELPPRAGDAEAFEPEIFETETYEPPPHETGMPAPEPFEPEDDEVDEPDEEGERRGRFPRWIVSAIWIVGLIIWLVANALADRG